MGQWLQKKSFLFNVIQRATHSCSLSGFGLAAESTLAIRDGVNRLSVE